MNIVELLAQYRFDSTDDTTPYFVSDTNAVFLFNEAEEEACRRKLLLFDKTTTAVCQISVTSATDTYAKHSAIVAVHAANLVDAAGEIINLDIVSRDELSRLDVEWREDVEEPKYLINDGVTVQIVPPPLVNYTLNLEVYRTPLTKMFLPVSPVPDPAPDPLVESPEIAAQHHRFLVFWVLFRYCSRPDVDTVAKSLAIEYERKFTEYFGPQRSADQDKLEREDMLIRNNVTL